MMLVVIKKVRDPLRGGMMYQAKADNGVTTYQYNRKKAISYILDRLHNEYSISEIMVEPEYTLYRIKE